MREIELRTRTADTKWLGEKGDGKEEEKENYSRFTYAQKKNSFTTIRYALVVNYSTTHDIQ